MEIKMGVGAIFPGAARRGRKVWEQGTRVTAASRPSAIAAKKARIRETIMILCSVIWIQSDAGSGLKIGIGEVRSKDARWH
jgi:hypothetical protein